MPYILRQIIQDARGHQEEKNHVSSLREPKQELLFTWATVLSDWAKFFYDPSHKTWWIGLIPYSPSLVGKKSV